MTPKALIEWLGFAVVLWFIGGPVGLLVAVAIGWYLLLRLDGKILIGIAAALFAGVPLMMVLNGLTSVEELQPQIVGTYATSNNLAFAGLVCLAVGVLLSVREQSDDEGDTAPERARHMMPDDVMAAVIDEGAVSMSIAQVDDIDLYMTLSEQEESGQVPQTATRRSLLTGAGWMAVFVVTQSVTGIGFWLLSSRFYPTETVGLASALFSLLLLVTFVTGMGLPVTIPLFAGGDDRESTTILTWALIYTTATSAVGTVLFLLIVKSDATTLLRDEGGAWGWVIFFVSVAGASIASLVDVRLMGARRWSLVFTRALIVGLGRIGLLFVPKAGNGALWLFSIGSLPVAVSGIFAVVILPGAAKIKYHLWPLPSRAFAAFRFASVNFLATLSSQAPTFILPVIVLANVEPTANAQYFLAWSAASVVFLFPTTIAQVLLVESSRNKQIDAVQARLRYLEALGLSFVIAVLATIVTFLFKGLVQTVFGPSYAGTAALLPLLVGAGIPWTFTAISLTRARLRKDSRAIIGTTATLGVVTIGGALVLVPKEGTVGAAIAWLCGQTIAALVAMSLDRLWTVMPPRNRRTQRAAEAAAAVGEPGDTESGYAGSDDAVHRERERAAIAPLVVEGSTADRPAAESAPVPSAVVAQPGDDLGAAGRRDRASRVTTSAAAATPRATPAPLRATRPFFDDAPVSAPTTDPAFEQGLDREALVEALFGSAGAAARRDDPPRPVPPDGSGVA